MGLTRWIATMLALGFAPSLAGAQDRRPQRTESAAEIEMGALHPSEVEMSAGRERRGSRARVHAVADEPAADDLRIGLQARLDALNTLSSTTPNLAGLGQATGGQHLLVPIVTPGLRWLEGRLFTGLGLGLFGASEDRPNMSSSRSGFSISPLATYDAFREDVMRLSIGGWLNFARLGETEVCTANACAGANDDITGWGLSLAAGVHARLARGLTLGGEFGWGFLSLSQDNGLDSFLHGLFGNIALEATIGL